MAAPNHNVFEWGGRLRDVRVGVPTKGGMEPRRPVCEMDRGPLGANYRWLVADLFEEICDADPMFQGGLFQVLRQARPEEHKHVIEAQLKRVFDDEYLLLLTQCFTNNLPYLVEYFLAKAARKKRHPEEFQNVAADTANGDTSGTRMDVPPAVPGEAQRPAGSPGPGTPVARGKPKTR